MTNLLTLPFKNIKKHLICYLALTIILMIAAAICTAGIPLIFKNIIDQLSIKNTDHLFSWLTLYLFLLILERLLNELQFISYPKWENGILKNAYLSIYQSLFNTKADFFRNKLYGAISNQIFQGIAGLDTFMFDLIFKTLPLIINFFFIIATIIYSLNLTIGLIIITGSLIYVIVMHHLNGKIIKNQIKLRNATINTQGITTDLIFSWKDIKLINAHQYAGKMINNHINQMLNAAKEFYYKRGLYGFMQSVIPCLIIGAANYYEISRYLNGQTTIGSIVLINNYLLLIMRPLEALSFIFRGLSKSFSDYSAINEILNSDKECTIPHNKLLPINSIHLTNITVDNVLNKINLSIRKGEKIAIIGESGTGKSTLLNIITGFKTDFTGKIYINQNESNLVDPLLLKNHIAYCSSDARLIKTSLADNISFGEPINIHEHLNLTELNNKAAQLDHGIHTIIAEEYTDLSAGEIQRIKIARTMALNRDFEFYDESTSSLDDNITEKILNNLLTRKNKAIVFITHNTKFLNLFDTVYILKNKSLLKINLEKCHE